MESERKVKNMKEEALKTATASWTIHLYVDCPNCDRFIDLMDADDVPALHDGDPLLMSIDPAKSYDESELKYFELIECPKCEKEFKLDSIEW